MSDWLLLYWAALLLATIAWTVLATRHLANRDRHGSLEGIKRSSGSRSSSRQAPAGTGAPARDSPQGPRRAARQGNRGVRAVSRLWGG
jgi:hypothetical protein